MDQHPGSSGQAAEAGKGVWRVGRRVGKGMDYKVAVREVGPPNCHCCFEGLESYFSMRGGGGWVRRKTWFVAGSGKTEQKRVHIGTSNHVKVAVVCTLPVRVCQWESAGNRL